MSGQLRNPANCKDIPLKEKFSKKLKTQLTRTCLENKTSPEKKLVFNNFLYRSLVPGDPLHLIQLGGYTHLPLSSVFLLNIDWELNCTRTRENILFVRLRH